MLKKNFICVFLCIFNLMTANTDLSPFTVLHLLNAYSAYHVEKSENFAIGAEKNFLSSLIYEAAVEGTAAQLTSQIFSEMINLYFPDNKIFNLKQCSADSFNAWFSLFNLHHSSKNLLVKKTIIKKNLGHFIFVIGLALTKAVGQKVFLPRLSEMCIKKFIKKSSTHHEVLDKFLDTSLAFIVSECAIEPLFMMLCAYLYAIDNDQSQENDEEVKIVTQLSSKATKALIGACLDLRKVFNC